MLLDSRRSPDVGGPLALIDVAAGLALLVVPYVAFNGIVSGQLLPNTFYAKQAEYQPLLARPLLERLWWVLRRPLTGAQVLLLPGFVWQIVQSLRDRGRDEGAESADGVQPSRFLRLLPAVWWVIYNAIYVLRMPVDYQHGRYLVPTIPFLILYGIAGTAGWLRPRSPRMVVRVLSKAIPLATGCLFLAFLILGRQAYADDVCIINGEMVDVASWLKTNTPPEALVAAHDIGAIGYLSGRRLLDLAGLITPEVIPIIRDENRLTAFILAREADYLVTFPSWYPEMTADERFEQVYQTGCTLTRDKGGDNMAVYRVRR
jgi:hypothetical protein